MQGYFLDDERNPQDVTWLAYPPNIEWRPAYRTAEDLLTALTQLPDYSDVVISFDHDLGTSNVDTLLPTGMDAIKMFVDHLLNISYSGTYPKILVHSMNPIGAKNIQGYWESFIK